MGCDGQNAQASGSIYFTVMVATTGLVFPFLGAALLAVGIALAPTGLDPTKLTHTIADQVTLRRA